MPEIKKISLIGPGLLGGSIGLAVRRSPSAPHVAAWARREETVRQLLEAGCADHASTDLEPVVDGADLVILATPVGCMEDLAQRVAACASLPDTAVVTDIGSVKQSVVEALEPVFTEQGKSRFIGSHPMAGSEKTGVAAARADLFDGAVCLLTPSAISDAEALDCIDGFWRGLGMQTLRLGAAEHDVAVARISHLPHLCAAALVLASVDEEAKVGAVAGPGFLDATRIAAGPAAMWAEILLENRAAVRDQLEVLQQRLGETLAFLDGVNEEDLRAFLAEAKRRRDLVSATTQR